ncbi:MAG: ParB/RepB/Spo0J family partition protein [Actinomycetota bacterium]
MTVRGGLGRGLGALIPGAVQVVEEIATSQIVASPRQPRRSFDQASIDALAASIQEVGILQPVVVRPSDGCYEIVLGERRWRAAQRAGLVTVPALIVDTDERGALVRALVENVHRQDLNAIEEAAAYQQLIEEGGLTHEQLAQRLGLSRPAVTNALRLLELSPAIQRLIVEGRLSAGHGRALLSLAGSPLLERLALRVAAEGLSVRETEEMVRRRHNEAFGRPVDRPVEAGAGGRPAALPAFLEVAERLSDVLQSRVRVEGGRNRGRNGGRIVIEFASMADLDRIFRNIVRLGDEVVEGPVPVAVTGDGHLS